MNSNRRIWLSSVLAILSGCSKRSGPTSTVRPGSTISVGSVEVEGYKVMAGEVDSGAIRKGLESMTQALAKLVADARRANPGLHGSFEGTLHIEPDGKIRVFMEGKSSIQEGGNSRIVDEFGGPALFGTAFPRLGQDCLLWVKFSIRKER